MSTDCTPTPPDYATRLDRTEFLLSEVYAHADELAQLDPKNAHIRDKNPP
jgi:hypothetical protein